MSDAAKIVEALGGTVAVAKALELSPSTVSSWKTSGRIPRWWMPGIKAFAKEKGVDLAALAAHGGTDTAPATIASPGNSAAHSPTQQGAAA